MNNSFLVEFARQYIQDKDLQRVCGYRGALNRKEMKPEVAAAVFASQPPKLLKPIITAQGSHLVFVEEILKAQLDDSLKAQIQSELFMKWLEKQIQTVEIEFIQTDLSKTKSEAQQLCSMV